MSLLAGILRVEDTKPLTALAPDVVADAVNQLLERYQQERDQFLNLLVDGEVINPQMSFTLGAIDEGQELGPDGRPLETRPFGKIDVAFPLKRIGWATGWNFETFAYMTVADLERLTAARQGGNARRHVREAFRALFNNVNYTFTDDRHGNLTIRRLANQDGTIYPPAYGADAEAEDNHYLVSEYAPDAMSATNNPFATLAAEIKEHFDTTTAVVAIINPAQRAEVLTALTNFVDAPTAGIRQGDDTAVAEALEGINVPGTFLGTDGDSGVFVYVDDRQRVPANYIAAFGVGVAPPLKRRVPEAESLRGFKLEADEDHDPMFKRTYRDRWGYAAANRLGAAIMFLDAGSSYTIPAAYA